LRVVPPGLAFGFVMVGPLYGSALAREAAINEPGLCRPREQEVPAPQPIPHPDRHNRQAGIIARVDSLRMFGHVARRLDRLRVQGRRRGLRTAAGGPLLER
jgi:hypothetical protein